MLLDAWKTHYELGKICEFADDIEAAIYHFQKAIQFQPKNADLYHALACAFRQAKQPVNAITACDQALIFNPDHRAANMTRASMYLLLGDFEKGWYGYEERLRDGRIPETGRPKWNRESLIGKTITIFEEQGLGDRIQFIRYTRLLKELGATVWLVSEKPVYRLFRECKYIDAIFRTIDPLPPFDFHVALLSLMGIFQTRLQTIPVNVPYLRPPAEAGRSAIAVVSQYQHQLKIGLTWAGSLFHPNNHRRSCGLLALRELFARKDIRFFSLQKGEPAKKITELPDHDIVDLGPYLTDFADTAAVIQELDLVISVDTAVAHLAGALGRPIWVLLPFVAEWRWMLDREDSPWYPTMRLFRQTLKGDWSDVLRRVSKELNILVEEKMAARHWPPIDPTKAGYQ